MSSSGRTDAAGDPRLADTATMGLHVRVLRPADPGQRHLAAGRFTPPRVHAEAARALGG